MESYPLRMDFQRSCADAVTGDVITDAGRVGPSFITHKVKKLYKKLLQSTVFLKDRKRMNEPN